MTIERAEAEFAKIKKSFEVSQARIDESGGSSLRVWAFNMRHRIRSLGEKIKDLHDNKIRSDKKTEQEIKIENDIQSLDQDVDGLKSGQSLSISP